MPKEVNGLGPEWVGLVKSVNQARVRLLLNWIGVGWGWGVVPGHHVVNSKASRASLPHAEPLGARPVPLLLNPIQQLPNFRSPL